MEFQVVVFGSVFGGGILQFVQLPSDGVIVAIFDLVLCQLFAVLRDVVQKAELEIGIGE